VPDLREAVPGRVTVVGPCGAGKSELVSRLLALGYEARHCAQEHSYVPDMWQRISRPEILVFLDAAPAVIARRRCAPLDELYLAEERRRLAHARAHCQVYVDTDALDPEQVAAAVQAVLTRLMADSGGRQRNTSKRSLP
jgi:RNase adaptor protein for sRNA GlmZ degradation